MSDPLYFILLKCHQEEKRWHHNYPFYYPDNFQRFRAEIGKTFKNKFRDFPGGPGIKTSPSHAGGAGSIPCGELRHTCLAAKKPGHKQ